MPEKCKQSFEFNNALGSKTSSSDKSSLELMSQCKSSNINNKSSKGIGSGHVDSFRDLAQSVPAKPINIKGSREPMLLSQTPDLVVLDRMTELESAVATVKSSLDNQASSYYSVASQIADTPNASMSATSISSGSCVYSDSIVQQPYNTALMQNAESENAQMSVKDNNDDDDEHYTRIQEMIDSLIKDADSALNSNPKRRLYHQQQQEQQQEQQEQEQKTLMHSDDSTDLQFTCDPLCSPEQLSSVSTVFDDAPSPSYPRPSSSRRLAANQSASSYRTPEICPRRPVSAMSMSYKSSRLRRYRPQTPVSKPRLLDTDPSEADAESDTELGSISASSSRLRNNYNIGHPHKRRQDASVAGKRVMGTVDKIAQSESSVDTSDSITKAKAKGKEIRRDTLAFPQSTVNDRNKTNVASTVGRFVRWYIEEPDDCNSKQMTSNSSSCPASFTKTHSLRAHVNNHL
ncbi:hypothetical protein LPJ64_003545 [Coemansia asiatica]|uniref:Uncharacterized protein n=1 Tax=Coemansia asiatica TaxID=1052880 RepID=A0A9W7XKX0_9FUNG|nr:hypothetical protein LPJ64_003545 [Coemansia asiatica]